MQLGKQTPQGKNLWKQKKIKRNAPKASSVRSSSSILQVYCCHCVFICYKCRSKQIRIHSSILISEGCMYVCATYNMCLEKCVTHTHRQLLWRLIVESTTIIVAVFKCISMYHWMIQVQNLQTYKQENCPLGKLWYVPNACSKFVLKNSCSLWGV